MMNEEFGTISSRVNTLSLSPRILVAEDEFCVRSLLAALLASSGYEVDVVEDGAAAWEALQTRSYNLLITDHHMPNVTGVELVRNMRAAQMALPVVMVVGEIPSALSPLKVAAIVLKPFDLGELVETVKGALRGVLPVTLS